MLPFTRHSRRSGSATSHRQVTATAQPGSTQDNPIELEDTPPPEHPAASPTKPKGSAVNKTARDAKGRFIKSEAHSEPKADRNKVVKATPPPKSKKPAPLGKTECIICATSRSKRVFKASAVEGTCGHFEIVCDTCVQKQIRTKISARQLIEAHLPCMFPECEAVLDLAALKSILSKALFQTWDAAVTKHFLAADETYITCLNPKCGDYFSIEHCGSKDKKTSSDTNSKSKSTQEENNKPEKVACPYCEHQFCLSCNCPWHSSSCDSVKKREDKQSEDAIKKLGAKPCPGCGANIEKRGGCDHMNCRRCRLNFCWECLGTFNGNYNNHAETCSHRRPAIAHDPGNFVQNNLTVAQLNALIERARQDRDAGRVPQPNVQLGQLHNGVAVGLAPPRVPVPRPHPQAQAGGRQRPTQEHPHDRDSIGGVAPRRNTGSVAPRRRIVLRDENELTNDNGVGEVEE